jgi:hypothetical protein
LPLQACPTVRFRSSKCAPGTLKSGLFSWHYFRAQSTCVPDRFEHPAVPPWGLSN